MTTLCPAVEEMCIKLDKVDMLSLTTKMLIASYLRKGATLQAEYDAEQRKKEIDTLKEEYMKLLKSKPNPNVNIEWLERERVKKAVDTMIATMDSFYDGGFYIGNIDFIKELPKKGEMIEARIHALMLLKKELGIEQEEKEK